VFTNFAKLEIETSKTLSIITRVLPGTNIHELPSWVPDWSNSIQVTDHAFLYDVVLPQVQFSSSGPTRAVVHFSANRIAFKGINIGSIKLLSLQSRMEHSSDEPNGTRVLLNLWKLITGMGKISGADLEAFIRVLVFDKVKKENLGNRTKSEFLLGILGYLGLVFSDSKLIEAKALILSYWKSFLVLEKKDDAIIQESFVEAEAKEVMASWWAGILRRVWDRRFFISSSKAMGLASEEVVEGDLICIPLGCCHPVIIRKVEDHYINLGEAYVDGYMYGEAMEMLERGELKLEEFELR
jgi:hypothetical protein